MKNLTRKVATLCLCATLAIFAGLAPGSAGASHIEIAAENAPPGRAVLELGTDLLVTMTPTPFRLILKDASGLAIRGAQVGCELTMPSMAMPENRPQVSEGDGAYVGTIIFTCAQGAWRLSCEVAQKDGTRQTWTFAIPRARIK